MLGESLEPLPRERIRWCETCGRCTFCGKYYGACRCGRFWRGEPLKRCPKCKRLLVWTVPTVTDNRTGITYCQECGP